MRSFASPVEPFQNAPLSQAVRHGNMIFVSGQLGLDKKGMVVSGGAGPETDAAIEALGRHLEELGGTLKDVVKTLVFLVSMDDYADYNEAYQRHFTSEYPARASVVVSELALGGRVEIEAIAMVDE